MDLKRIYKNFVEDMDKMIPMKWVWISLIGVYIFFMVILPFILGRI